MPFVIAAGVGTRRAEAEAASSPAPQPKRLRASVATPQPGLSKGSLSRAAAGVIAATGDAMPQGPGRGTQALDGEVAVGASWSVGDGRAPEVSSRQAHDWLCDACSVHGAIPPRRGRCSHLNTIGCSAGHRLL